MIEVGLGLLAVCLPTLRSLCKGLPAATTDGLKSFFTLRAFRSQQSVRIHNRSTDRIHDVRQDPSISPQNCIHRAGKQELYDIEANSMTDLRDDR